MLGAGGINTHNRGMTRAMKTTGGAAKVGEAGPGSWHQRLTVEVERLVGGPLEGKRLETIGKALGVLHRRFVSESPPEEGPSYFADRATLAAYLAYFVPASQAQVARALAEVTPPGTSILRVLDLGSGPGPASNAVAEWAATYRRSVHVTAVDASSEALDAMKRLWSGGFGPLETRTWKAGEGLPSGPYDVIVAAHVLNELFLSESTRLDHRAQLAAELGKRLTPGGLLVLVEPALRRTGRELLVIRDRLLAKGGLSVLAPCFFQGACPALTRPRDWCHADRPWDAPPLPSLVGEAAGLSRESLKFSYVVLSNALPSPERARDPELFRIVSEPLPEKGKLKYFGCGGAGRHPLVRLDREASEANAAFGTLERGDVVRVQGTVASGDGKRVTPAVTVEVTLSARSLDGGKRE